MLLMGPISFDIIETYIAIATIAVYLLWEKVMKIKLILSFNRRASKLRVANIFKFLVQPTSTHLTRIFIHYGTPIIGGI